MHIVQKKIPIVKAALEKLLGYSLDNKKIPEIAAIGSGGGIRAMLAFIGSLYGLEKERILPCIIYVVGLSGSTWAIAPWLSSKMSLFTFKNYILEKVKQPIYRTTDEERLLLADMIAVREMSGQKPSLVDIYGGLLGNKFLSCLEESRHITYLSEQKKIIKNGSRPYPIYTAINANAGTELSWYTFTPHKVTNLTYKVCIPTFGCGRAYDNKRSTNTAREINLSVLMGTWGSAFAVSWDIIIKTLEAEEPEYVQQIETLKQLVNPKGKTRPIPCELRLPNFTKGMNLPISDYKYLEVVDAGMDINLPYPPVSGIIPERKADICLFFDNSAGEHIGAELLKCAEFAEKHKLPFPVISVDKIETSTISVFSDPNPDAPLVIYMPGISDHALWEQYRTDSRFKKYDLSQFDLHKETNHGFCQTYHFQYPENAHLVIDQTTFNVRANREKLIDAIRWKIDNMSQ